MKREIHRSGTEDYRDHRADFQTCPHCDYKMDTQKWARTAHILILEPHNFKAGSIAIVTECPNCYEDSWVHQPMDSFEYADRFPMKWKEAVHKQEKKVRLQALRDWAAGLCGRCKDLQEGSVSYTTRRACPLGFGGVETECDKFKPVKGKP